MAKYLDWGGLLTLWNKIKSWVGNYVKFETETGTGADAITIGNVTKVPILSISAGAGLNTTGDNSSVDGGVIGMGSGQSRSGTLYLTKSGVTAGSYGEPNNQNITFGSGFLVPKITVDKYGRTTNAQDITITLPSLPIDTSIGSTSSSNLPTSDAVKNYVTSQMSSVVGALVYLGTVTSESALLNVELIKGWYYIVNVPTSTPSVTSINIGGIECEAGDMIIVKTTGTYTTSAGLAGAIDVIQSNVAAITDVEINSLS